MKTHHRAFTPAFVLATYSGSPMCGVLVQEFSSWAHPHKDPEECDVQNPLARTPVQSSRRAHIV